ncbi:MAG: hypothetical protein ACI9DJ_001409 [Algoriphagus sp.]|jgi:hypothetical protein
MSLNVWLLEVSFTLGVRDGGYFNEGIKTTFPADLANHFGIKNFS